MYGCGEQEVSVASGSEWNLWVWLLGVVVRTYIDFLILLIPTPLVSVLFFYNSIPTFCSLKKKIFVLVYRISSNRGLSRIEAGLVYRPGVLRLNLAIVAGSRIKAGLSTHAPRVPCHALYATYSSIVEART